MQRRERRPKTRYCDDCDADSRHTEIFMSVYWGDMRLCEDCIEANEDVCDSKWEPMWGPDDD
jgi:hypothetical protein